MTNDLATKIVKLEILKLYINYYKSRVKADVIFTLLYFLIFCYVFICQNCGNLSLMALLFQFAFLFSLAEVVEHNKEWYDSKNKIVQLEKDINENSTALPN